MNATGIPWGPVAFVGLVGLFWLSLGFLAWVYVGYPLFMAALARFRPRPVRLDHSWHPTVSVLIPARDEASVLGAKLESVLAQGWPRERLQIVVVDDGSRDRTADVVRRFADRGVELVELRQSLGKAAALNRGVAYTHGEILVLTDARQPLVPGALAALVAPFGDLYVGAVSGELALPGADSAAVAAGRAEPLRGEAGAGLGLYRKIDDRVRRWEAASGSSVGVTGALWALRRSLWTPLVPGTILDDLVEPLLVVRQGQRVVVAPGARAIDAAAPGGSREFVRRVRTLAGNLQLLRMLPWARSWRENPIWFRLVSHKLLRLVAPAGLVALFVSNLLLIWQNWFYTSALAGQIVFYGLAMMQPPQSLVARSAVASWRPVLRLARVAHSFTMLHVAAAVAVWRFIEGREGVLWREAAPVSAWATGSEATHTFWPPQAAGHETRVGVDETQTQWPPRERETREMATDKIGTSAAPEQRGAAS
ncbi:MAG TPA: glycosyltransferase family 2 protein [Polyangia bacterium]|nr:glycosyltransferase family 2 protein [Polyangia bacterium]